MVLEQVNRCFLQLGYGFKLRYSAFSIIKRTVLRASIYITDGDSLAVVIELINAFTVLVVGKRCAILAV